MPRVSHADSAHMVVLNVKPENDKLNRCSTLLQALQKLLLMPEMP